MSSAPPQNIEAEESVLGAMLVTASALVQAIDEVGLVAEDFYLDRHRAIFTAIADLRADAKPIDEIGVADELTRQGHVEAAGGKHYVSDLAAKVPAAGNAAHYAEIVRGHALDRGKIKIGQGLTNGLAPAEAIEGLRELERRRGSSSSTWRPVALDDALAGEDAPGPTILARSDGVSLIYRGRLTQAAGEPESGKSWLVLQACAEELRAGNRVVYIDFEGTEVEAVQRLRAIGVEEDVIRDGFDYLRPAEPLSDANRGDLEALLEAGPVLAVVDGVTEAMALHGLDLNDNGEVAVFLDLFPRPAARAGAAVVLVDHVVKDREQRGRYAIGGQHKLASVDVAYTLEVVEPFGRGGAGLVRIRVAKDRPGHVRRHAEADQVALMRISSDAESGAVTVRIDPPDATGEGGEFRPTVLMERISRAVEASPGMTTREIRDLGGNTRALDTARKLLADEGYVEVDTDGRAHRHTSLRPFRKDTEEAES